MNADNLVTTGNDFTGMNLFAYCSNNPVKFQDSDGHLGFLTACFIIGVVGLVADVISGGARERANAMLSDPTPYNVVNWATAGFADTVKGAVAPEEPLSVQHWTDSFAVATAIMTPLSKLPVKTPVTSTPKLNPAPINPGKTFKPGQTGFQYGVNPNTLIPQKDLTILDPQRIANAVKFGGDQSIRVGRTGIIQDGHHRVADAIRNGRTIDVFVEPYK